MSDTKQPGPPLSDGAQADLRIWNRATTRRQLLKTAIGISATVAAAPIIAACSAAATAAPTAAPASAVPATANPAPTAAVTAAPATAAATAARSLDPNKVVRVWIQGYGDPTAFNAALDKITKGFKDTTGLTVKFEVQDWSTAEQKWDLAMTTGDPPDVGDMFYLPSRVVQGQGKWGPVNLTDRVMAGAFGNWERFLKSTRDESTIGGLVYAIPWRIDIRTWNHRSDLWPKAPATIQELETLGLEVLKKAGVKAAAEHFAQPVDAFHQGGLAFGCSLLTPDYKASSLDDPKWVEASQWLRDMSKKNIFLAQSELDAKFDQPGAFFNGTAGAIWGSGTVLEQAQATAPQIAPLIVSALQPAGPGGPSKSHGSCAQWSIFEKTQALEESVELVKYITTPDVAAALCKATSTISADMEVEKLDQNPYTQAFYEQGKNLDPTDMPIVAWNEMRVFPDGPLNVLANRIWGTTDDIKTILAEGHTEITDILKKYA
jgi:ABC-type glycerol-3-phosphate transport system substrate-binding protein